MLAISLLERNPPLKRREQSRLDFIETRSTPVKFGMDYFACSNESSLKGQPAPTAEDIKKEVNRIKELEEIKIKTPTLQGFIKDLKGDFNAAEAHLPIYEREVDVNPDYKPFIERFQKNIKILPVAIKLLEKISDEKKKELNPKELNTVIREGIKKQQEILELLKKDEVKNKEEISVTNEIIKVLEYRVEVVSEYHSSVKNLTDRAVKNLLAEPEERQKDLNAAALLLQLKKYRFAQFTLTVQTKDKTQYIGSTEQLQKAYELIREKPEIGEKLNKYFKLVEKIQKIDNGDFKPSVKIEKIIFDGKLDSISKKLDDLIESLCENADLELRIHKHTWRNTERRSFQEAFSIVKKDLDKLFSSNEEAKELAEKIRNNPTPENIVSFVAFVERNSEFLKHDLPGWEGNNYYNAFESRVIDGRKCFQGGCTAEAEVTAYILDFLKQKEILSRDCNFYMTYMGLHWALAVFRDKYDDGFIIDRWIAKPGKNTPAFKTYEDWRYGARDFMDKEREKVKKEQEELLPFYSLKNQYGSRQDNTFLKTWSKNNVSHYRFYISSNERNDLGGNQDFIIFKYFLGEQSLLPKDVITPEFFDGVKIKVSHCLDLYGISKKNEILKCKDLKELEKYLKLYFIHFYTESSVVRKMYPDWGKIIKETPKF